MKRVVFYVVHASAEENQSGAFHFSDPLPTVEEALKLARKTKDDFVVIEKYHEVYDRWEWRVDHDGYGDRAMEIIDW